MGCDVHVTFEVKLKGKWELYSQPNIRRDYELFEKMAGVRGKAEKAMCPPKGLPDDISALSKLIHRHTHTHSWFDADQINQIIKWDASRNYRHSQEWGYLFGNGWDDWGKYRSDYPEEIEDIRMVFSFDS